MKSPFNILLNALLGIWAASYTGSFLIGIGAYSLCLTFDIIVDYFSKSS